MPRRSPTRSANQKKSWIIPALVGLFLVPTILIVGIKLWADSYLRSAVFREMLNRTASDALRADVTFEQPAIAGNEAYAAAISIKGRGENALKNANVNSARTRFRLSKWIGGSWLVEDLTFQQVHLELLPTNPSQVTTRAVTDGIQTTPARAKGWLPTRVDLERFAVNETNLEWPGGQLNGVTVRAERETPDWLITGTGGRFAWRASNLPEMRLDRLRARLKDKDVFLQEVELRSGKSGIVSGTGEITATGFRSDFKVQRVDLSPLLQDDWRARLKGELSGSITLRSDSRLNAKGNLRVENAVLEALPFLNQLSEFTRNAQYRRVTPSILTSDFLLEGERLTVRHLEVEQEGVLRVEGAFVVENEVIDGTFEVGIPPSSIHWLPAAYGAIFPRQAGAYLWTTVRVTGPIRAPKEDLTPRLGVVLKDAAINTAQEGVRKVIQGVDAVKDAGSAVKEVGGAVFNRMFGE